MFPVLTILHLMVSKMTINFFKKYILIIFLLLSKNLYSDFSDEDYESSEDIKNKQEKIIKKTPFGNVEHNRKAKVPFSSKRARISKKHGTIELIGNVSIEQAGLNIKANHITITSNTEKSSQKNDIKSFKAEGNVRVRKEIEDKSSIINAKAKKLLYVIDNDEILLEGDARVQKREETIQGHEILINTKTGHVKILSAKGLLEKGHSNK